LSSAAWAASTRAWAAHVGARLDQGVQVGRCPRPPARASRARPAAARRGRAAQHLAERGGGALLVELGQAHVALGAAGLDLGARRVLRRQVAGAHALGRGAGQLGRAVADGLHLVSRSWAASRS
jgi:hypothetical protein